MSIIRATDIKRGYFPEHEFIGATGRITWVPTRPVDAFVFQRRWREVWLVLTGRADALVWDDHR